ACRVRPFALSFNMLLAIPLLLPIFLYAQPQNLILHGVVRSANDGSLIAGASVSIQNEKGTAITDRYGRFSVPIRKEQGTVFVSYVGYEQKKTDYTYSTDLLEIAMTPADNILEQVEVVSTGYNTVPKERATGAFEVIDKNVMRSDERRVG